MTTGAGWRRLQKGDYRRVERPWYPEFWDDPAGQLGALVVVVFLVIVVVAAIR